MTLKISGWSIPGRAMSRAFALTFTLGFGLALFTSPASAATGVCEAGKDCIVRSTQDSPRAFSTFEACTPQRLGRERVDSTGVAGTGAVLRMCSSDGGWTVIGPLTTGNAGALSLDYLAVNTLDAGNVLITGNVATAGVVNLAAGCLTISGGVTTLSCTTQTSTNQSFTLGANGSVSLGSGSGAFDGIAGSAGYKLASRTAWAPTTPTISSGFGTSPSVTAGISTAAFRVNVGTGGVATTGVIALNTTATTGWNCFCTDITTTTAAVDVCKMTASNTTTVTLGNFTSGGIAGAWVASDILAVNCTAY